MIMKIQKLLLPLVLCWCLYCALPLDIYVDQTHGKDDSTCIQDKANHSCKSLSYIASNIKASPVMNVHIIGDVRINCSVKFGTGLGSSLSVIGQKQQNVSRLLCISGMSHKNVSSRLWFSKITTLQISNLEIIGCGVMQNKITESNTILYKTGAGIAISECLNTGLHNVIISESTQTSLLIYMPQQNGTILLSSVVIKNNQLSKNMVPPGRSYTGGVAIFLNTLSNDSGVTCMIKNCTFSNLKTPHYEYLDPTYYDDLKNDWLGYGLGGGLSVIFNSSGNDLSVEGCTFELNKAPFGAGMYVKFFNNTGANILNINTSNFIQCTAHVSGGGLEVGFFEIVYDTNTTISQCRFAKNYATYGGGTHFHSYFSQLSATKAVLSQNCTWTENRGRYSPAVDVSPTQFDLLGTGLLPNPKFKDCTFHGNRIVPYQDGISEYVNFGIFVVSRFTVHFAGTTTFISNNSTALMVTSGTIKVLSNSTMDFFNNTGSHGGAISLQGFSSLSFSDNTHFTFTSNSATEFGGAIHYYSIEQREFFEGHDCFLWYSGDLRSAVHDRNISFEFLNNTAVIAGSSIFASSLTSCYYAYNGNLTGHKIQEFFNKIGNFSFNGQQNLDKLPEDKVLATTGYQFKNKENDKPKTLKLIPGMNFILPVIIQDDLNQTVSGEFLASVNSNIVQLYSHYTMNQSLTLYGYPQQAAKLTIVSLSPYRRVQHSMDVELQSCPPGFFLQEKSCVCSADNSSQTLPGIRKCNHDFTANLHNGYWAGYDNTGELYTALCPFQFCKYRMHWNDSLPQQCDGLTENVCTKNRMGTVCGQCKLNFSTAFHSDSFQCVENKSCSLGPLYFLLAEIFPVFVLITLIVIIDVSFSSGYRNGLVLFSQVISILPLDLSTHYRSLPRAYIILQKVYNMFYGLFNFTVFSVEELKFCLFKGATVMDALVFKYITALFAFLMVIIITVCVNYCSCYNKLFRKILRKRTQLSVLRGLSACLVICYTELVRVSFFVLRKVYLLGPGGIVGPVVTFYGGLEYLGVEHSRYAMPAIFILATFGVFPPLLLIFYPSGLKLLQLCKLSEHPLVHFIIRCSRIDKFMPMFDVFQGSFKDNLRFFSGLYFIYRAALLIPYLICHDILCYMKHQDDILSIILFIHAIFQPYKSRKNNVIDILLIGNLMMISKLSAWVYPGIKHHINTLYIQLILIYLPIVILAIALLLRVYKYIKRKTGSLDMDTTDRNNYEFIVGLDHIDRNLCNY